MTVQELINLCLSNGVDLNTHIALRAKDDYLLIHSNIKLDNPYFGNCGDGDRLLNQLTPRDAEGELDYDNAPNFLILDTGRG